MKWKRLMKMMAPCSDVWNEARYGEVRLICPVSNEVQ